MCKIQIYTTDTFATRIKKYKLKIKMLQNIQNNSRYTILVIQLIYNFQWKRSMSKKCDFHSRHQIFSVLGEYKKYERVMHISIHIFAWYFTGNITKY